MGLDAHGRTDIARVGSFKRITKSLLKYTVHQMELQSSESKDAVFELNAMLKDFTSNLDKSYP